MGDTVQWKENGRIKLMIIVGTRPEIIRLAAVIKNAGSILTQFWSIRVRTMTTTSTACFSGILALPTPSCI